MMYDTPATSAGSHHSPDSDDHSLVPDRISVAVDYWVIDETGGLADPDRVSAVPGATAGTTPHSIAVETPPTESCAELRAHLGGRLQTAVAVAHKQECRLLPLGLRPDLLTETDASGETDQPPPAATAGTRITFAVDPAAAVDVYNILLALDPAFALLNTTRWSTENRQYACGRSATRDRTHRVPPYRADGALDPDAVDGQDRKPDAADDAEPEPDRWQPVRFAEPGRIEWRALDATTPTLLVDLLADVVSVLREASTCRLDVESFGNGFDVGCLSLPSRRWRELYAEQAAHRGAESVVLRAYLDRIGIETGWYLAAAPPAVGSASSTELPTLCRRRAALLEADLGVAEPVSG